MRRLYTFFRSSTSYRLRIALALKGLDWEPSYISLPGTEHRAQDYMTLNPQGLVPALIEDDGAVLAQSLAIMEYLEEKYPNPPLMPKDPYLRGRGRVLVDYALNYIHEPYWSLRGEMLKPEPERNSATLEQTRARLRELLQYLETALGENDYFLGALSLADIDVLPRFLRMESYGALPTPGLPQLSAWLQRMKERPSVKAIL